MWQRATRVHRPSSSNMDLVCKVLLFVFGIGLVPASSQPSLVPPEVVGVWSTGSIDTVGSVQGQECSALTIPERRIRLSAIPGTNKLEGVWIRTATNIWRTTDNPNCRWFPEDSKFRPIFQTTWFYVLGAVYDAARGVMKVDGTFANCDGNGCEHSAAATTKRPFHTELKMNNGRLVSTHMTDDPNDDLELVRVDDEEDRADDAKTAWAAWLKILDAGDFGRFYDQATTPSFRSIASRKDFIDRLSAQRDRVGTTMSRLTKTLYVEHAPFLSKSLGEYVLFWSGVELTKSGRALEFMLLVNDGGAWKVTWLNYAS
jgi:Protein of unknown function (DUF4019)